MHIHSMERVRHREVNEAGMEKSDEGISNFAKIAASNMRNNIARQEEERLKQASVIAAENINANVKRKKK